MKLSQEKMQELQAYVGPKLHEAISDLDARRCYYNSIYNKLHGDIGEEENLTTAERRRRKAQEKHPSTTFPDDILRFGDANLRNLVNDIVNITMPVDRPYTAVADPASQDTLDTFMSALIQYATAFGHRTEYSNMVYDLVTTQDYAATYGWQERDEYGFGEVEGATFQSLDLYNTVWDSSVAMKDVARDGVLFAWEEPTSQVKVYRAQRGIDDYVVPKSGDPAVFLPRINEGNLSGRQYRKNVFDRESGRFDYTDEFGQLTQSGAANLFKDTHINRQGLYELTCYCRVPATILGLPGEELLQVKLTAVNGILVHVSDPISEREPFPVIAGNLYGSRDAKWQQGYGEHAAGMNTLISGLMNLQKLGMRREANGGTTVYDTRVADFTNLNNGYDTATNTIGINIDAAVADTDVRKYIMQIGNDAPTNRLGDIAAFSNLMSEVMFPKSARADVLNLDRATAFHSGLAASMADGTLIALGILVDDSVGVPMRRALRYTVQEHLSTVNFVNPKKRELQTLTRDQLKDLEYEFSPSQILAGFDRNRVMGTLREIMNQFLQAPQLNLPPNIMIKMAKNLMDLASSGTIDLLDYLDEQQVTQPQPQPQPTTTGDTNV